MPTGLITFRAANLGGHPRGTNHQTRSGALRALASGKSEQDGKGKLLAVLLLEQQTRNITLSPDQRRLFK